MRRLVLTTFAAIGIAAGLATPALAQTSIPVPVGVGGNGNGGECVYAFTWVPQCVDTGQIGSAIQLPH